jgi:4-amino-4-deoxy-L-arabinose transferase-like glycosyltransferase
LAITPIVVATDRNNTIDSTLILTLLLATWAFIKATETSKLRYLFLGVVFVGIGFNIKMLQAYLPLPAFYALYFLGSSETIWRKAGKLLLATLLLLTISLSWSVAVDLTPVDQRPYVGSSSDNSELNLIVGYNGIQRLLGMFGRGGFTPRDGDNGVPNDGQFPLNPPAFPPAGNNPNGNGFRPDGNNVMRSGNGPGGFNIGEPGALRFFIEPLSKEVSWLLPFGLISMILLAAGSRWRWPFTQKHQALVLWGLWILTCLVFFSIAGFFHEYYLSMLGAPLAALVAIGITELWDLGKTKPVLAASILSVAAIGTIAFQVYTANNFVETIWWIPAVVVLLAAGIATMALAIRKKYNINIATGFALTIVAMLLTPGIWSVYTILSASQNQSLPASYSGEAIGPVAQRGLQINQSLLDYLQANTSDTEYLMAVPSAMQGADYVLATGRPVLYIGGFNGQDQVVSSDDLEQMVKDGELRYVYWSAEGRGPAGANAEISSWVTSSCTAIQGFDTATQNAGVPDGTETDQNNSFSQTIGGPFRGMQVTLYDCASVN